jgi:hypothetical protein
VPSFVVDYSLADRGIVSQRRECDTAQGITTECAFVD